MLVLFGAASEAAVELAIYEAVAAGRAKTADDLDEIARRAASRYTSRFEAEPERKGVWMMIESLYGSPMHSVADPLAGLLVGMNLAVPFRFHFAGSSTTSGGRAPGTRFRPPWARSKVRCKVAT